MKNVSFHAFKLVSVDFHLTVKRLFKFNHQHKRINRSFLTEVKIGLSVQFDSQPGAGRIYFLIGCASNNRNRVLCSY